MRRPGVTSPGWSSSERNFELNHSYADTDVFISIAKLKNHKTAGVTLSMKNLFGITPNSLYGDQAPREDALKGRGRMHERSIWDGRRLLLVSPGSVAMGYCFLMIAAAAAPITRNPTTWMTICARV